MHSVLDESDEIISIEYVGVSETIDINTSGNRLFYANGILTHNSAVDEIEFDHSHIAGGISKVNTADYVFGIFTSRSMRERGKYQIQCMKSRSSTGVGSKIDLDYNINTMRITDSEESDSSSTINSPNNIMSILKPSSTVIDTENTENSMESNGKKIVADVSGSKLKAMLSSLKK